MILWEGVVVLKELILTVSTLRGCTGLEITHFLRVYTLGGLTGLERTDFNTWYFGRVWWYWQKWFSTVDTLGGCGGLERTDF